MIPAICKECGHVWLAPVILGLMDCPRCKSKNTAVAVKQEKPERGEEA